MREGPMKPKAEPSHYNIHIYLGIITQRAKVELSWRDPARSGALRQLLRLMMSTTPACGPVVRLPASRLGRRARADWGAAHTALQAAAMLLVKGDGMRAVPTALLALLEVASAA
jgi:hypothetical protein